MDAGCRGRAAPCQRERSDRALDRVTAVGTFHRGDTTGSNRLPPFGLLAEAVPQQQRAGNRSGARSASRRRGVTTVKHRDTWSRQTAAAPPNRHNRYSRKTLNRPLCFTPGLHGLPALSGVLTPPCVTVRPGMSAFSRDLYFWTGRTNPPSAQIRGRGPELPLNRHGHVLSSVCLALTPSRRHRGVDRQKVADIAAWGRTADPCLGAD